MEVFKVQLYLAEQTRLNCNFTIYSSHELQLTLILLQPLAYIHVIPAPGSVLPASG